MNDSSWMLRPAPRAAFDAASPILGGRRVLIADSNAASIEVLARPLELQGMQVCRCTDVARLRVRLAQSRWDLVMLDPRIAGPAGLDLLREASSLPHLTAMIVTAADMTETDRIVALELGADHCIDRRCSTAELLAVVRALLSRRLPIDHGQAAPLAREHNAHFAGMRYDPMTRMLHDDNAPPRRIRSAEADLLMRFLRNPRKIFPREALIGPALAPGETRNQRAADVLVSRLRATLGDQHWDVIRTVRGRGYFLACHVDWR